MRTSRTANKNIQHWASFRDPAGTVFWSGGKLLRQVNKAGAEDFDLFVKSGLYDELAKENLIVSHKKVDISKALSKDAHTLIGPQPINYISYPFEWSFSQYKDAALLTLEIQKRALKYDMTLKDASAYNVQFQEGKPIFIDTLSFEKYEAGKPWQAYGQFCRHFLAPLILMAHSDARLSQLMRTNLDGIPLDLAASLLPARSKLKPSIAMHVVVHARAQKSKETSQTKPRSRVSRRSLEAILDSLERTIKKLQPKKTASEWGNYYDKTNYTKASADQKAKLLTKFVKPLKAKTAIDLGGNDGRYSRVLNELGTYTVCLDIDPNAVEANWRYLKAHGETNMLPLVVDLNNPAGGLGWHNQERSPVHERFKAEVAVALALIHHLAISNNLPFVKIAGYFREFAPNLIIEFVPKDDSQVQKLLATRQDIFTEYTEDDFIRGFGQYYNLVKSEKIKGSKRTLYLFKAKR